MSTPDARNLSVTDDFKRGIQHRIEERDIQDEETGGFSLDFWRGRRAGDALLAASQEAHYIYGDEGESFFYEDAS